MININIGKAVVGMDQESPHIQLVWPGKTRDEMLGTFWAYSGSTRPLVEARASGMTELCKRTHETDFWLKDVIELIDAIDPAGCADHFSGELWLQSVKNVSHECLTEFGDEAAICWSV